MSTPDTGSEEHRSRMSSLWRERRARWTLPLVIIVIIAGVAVVDHLGSLQISQVDQPVIPAQVEAPGGTSVVHLPGQWSGFNPNTPAGAQSSKSRRSNKSCFYRNELAISSNWISHIYRKSTHITQSSQSGLSAAFFRHGNRVPDD